MCRGRRKAGKPHRATREVYVYGHGQRKPEVSFDGTAVAGDAKPGRGFMRAGGVQSVTRYLGRRLAAH